MFAFLKIVMKIPGKAAVFCRKAEMVLYHGPAVRVILAVILLFWLLRNFTSSF